MKQCTDCVFPLAAEFRSLFEESKRALVMSGRAHHEVSFEVDPPSVSPSLG